MYKIIFFFSAIITRIFYKMTKNKKKDNKTKLQVINQQLKAPYFNKLTTTKKINMLTNSYIY